MEFACLRDSIETDNPTARLLSQRLGSVEKQLHVWIILNWNILKSELGERVKSGWVRAMRVYLTHVGSVTLFLSQTSCDIQHVWAPYLFPQELLSLLACRSNQVNIGKHSYLLIRICSTWHAWMFLSIPSEPLHLVRAACVDFPSKHPPYAPL